MKVPIISSIKCTCDICSNLEIASHAQTRGLFSWPVSKGLRQRGRRRWRKPHCDISKPAARIIAPVLIWTFDLIPVNDEPKTLVTIWRLIICFYAMSLRLSDRRRRFHNARYVAVAAQRRLSSASRCRYSTFDNGSRLKITCDNTGLIDVALGICSI